jgi:cellulose synthase/poly-beta-1,6-N-acetylglucosamine synthase-like glycosyltransferase
MRLPEFLFVLACFWVFYAYLGYPVLLYLLARLFGKPLKSATIDMETLPFVTLLISAYNEENAIRDKLENSLSLDYPRDRLEILVVSDASTDRTDAIVAAHAERGVNLLRQGERLGKTAALNMAVPQAKGSIVVFSDANAMYEKIALRHLVAPFSDGTVGFVSGRTRYAAQAGNSATHSSNLYTRLEIATKDLESRFASCVGADGAIFGIRKEAYRPLAPTDINDFVIPLNVIEKGYRGILASKAVCIEESAASKGAEFNRQVRITNRTLRAIFKYRHILSNRAYRRFSFCLVSHKLFKFLTPVFLLLALLCNILLAGSSLFFAFLLVLHVVPYALLAYGALRPAAADQYRLVSISHSFLVVNLAMLLGWMTYLAGKTYTTWSPERV